MPASISGTTLTYGNGETQTTAGGKIINYGFAKYSVRTTLPNAGSSEYTFWNAASCTRSKTNSYIRGVGLLPGHGYNSYPYGGVFISLVNVGTGARLTRWVGAMYQPNLEGSAQEIMMYCDYTWTDTEIGAATGTFRLDFGYWASNGSDNRWAVIWNPNASDDGRGSQKGSTSFIEEIIYG